MPRYAKYRKYSPSRSLSRTNDRSHVRPSAFRSALKNVNKGDYVFPSSYEAYAGLQSLMKKPRWKKKAQEEIGYAWSSSSCRVHETIISMGTFNTRTLNSFSVLNIPKTTTTFSMDSRLRDVINVSGIRLQWTVNNFLSSESLLVNVAILAPRDSNTGTVATSNFFRGGSGNDRAFDFDNNSDSNTLYHAAINVDDYVILYRNKHEVLHTDRVGTFDEYIPLKRQIRYNASGDPHQELRVVYWHDNSRAGSGILPQPNGTIGLRSLLYFRDEA